MCVCVKEKEREREVVSVCSCPATLWPYLSALCVCLVLKSDSSFSTPLLLSLYPLLLLPLHLMRAALAQLSEGMFTRSTLHVLLHTHTQTHTQTYKIENDPLSNVNSKVQIIARVDKMLFRLFMWLPGKQLCLNKKHKPTRDVRVTRHDSIG